MDIFRPLLSKGRTRGFAILLVVVGVVLLVVSIIRGSIMLVAFIKGVPLKTLRDINVNVTGVFFDFVIPFLGGLLLLAAGGVLLSIGDETLKRSVEHEKKAAATAQMQRHISTSLGAQEKAILEMISAAGNAGILQSDIVVKTGYSKVKVHRILKKLEVRDLINRGRFGITNKIFVKNPQ
jgi:uncharacterized membrane protein